MLLARGLKGPKAERTYFDQNLTSEIKTKNPTMCRYEKVLKILIHRLSGGSLLGPFQKGIDELCRNDVDVKHKERVCGGGHLPEVALSVFVEFVTVFSILWDN